MEEKNTPKVNSGFYIDIHTAIHDENNNPNIFPNFHKNFEILIVLNGNCTCDINGQKFSAKKDEAIFIFPFQLHSVSLDDNSSVRRITFHHHLILTIYQALEGKVPRSPVFHPSKSLLDMSVSFMDNEFGQDSGPISRIAPFETRMQTKGILYMLGGEFLANTELISAPESNTLITDIVQHISENFKSNITLKDIAQKRGYNYQYVSRVFNHTMKVNFKKITNRFRLEYALHLLQDTNESISTICFESGFQSIRSFNQICKEECGKTPKELRQSHKI